MDDRGARVEGPGDLLSLRSGNTIPVIGLGTWQLSHRTAEAVGNAIALGYRLIDTSGDYGTQPGIAEALNGADIGRERLYLVTKIEENEDAFEAAQRNVRELNVDQVDLLLIHRPPESGTGAALWSGLIRARDQGLTRDIGVSNYSVELMQRLADETGEMPAVNQIEWSPFGHNANMKAFADENDIRLQAYSPLTRGARLRDPFVADLAYQHGKSPAQVLIRWDLQSGVIPLPKANRIEHAKENLNVFDFILSADDMERLNSLNERYSALGELPY